MNPIQQSLQRVLSEYLQNKKEDIAGNYIARLLRKEIPASIIESFRIDQDSYRVYASPGQGNWATIPWIAIIDKEISTSTENGYYIVYLFNADMSGFHLCLSLGWTQYENEFGIKKGKKRIKADRDRFLLAIEKFDYRRYFTASQIDLKSNNTLARGYELGTVLSTYYESGSIPDDDRLRSDFKEMLHLYGELETQNLHLFSKEPVEVDYKHEVEIRAAEVYSPEQARKEIAKLSDEIAEQPVEVRQKVAKYLVRTPKWARLVKEAAHYQCEICGTPGFEQKNGSLYAEAHHIDELAKTRIDNPNKMICVCPTCHMVLHYGSRSALEERKGARA